MRSNHVFFWWFSSSLAHTPHRENIYPLFFFETAQNSWKQHIKQDTNLDKQHMYHTSYHHIIRWENRETQLYIFGLHLRKNVIYSPRCRLNLGSSINLLPIIFCVVECAWEGVVDAVREWMGAVPRKLQALPYPSLHSYMQEIHKIQEISWLFFMVEERKKRQKSRNNHSWGEVPSLFFRGILNAPGTHTTPQNTSYPCPIQNSPKQLKTAHKASKHPLSKKSDS